MNLLPKEPGKTPSYVSTWNIQRYVAIISADDSKKETLFAGDQGFLQQDYINEKILFDSPGCVKTLYEKVRGDLYFLVDQGWDVPYNTFDHTRMWPEGSMIPPSERYPSLTGTTPDKLLQLNIKMKAAGWRGLAVWLAAETATYADASEDKRVNFWRERAKWSREAGITYWKVDWGAKGLDAQFRRMVTKVAREEFPDLLVEHVRNMGPLNDNRPPWDNAASDGEGRFMSWGSIMEESLRMLSFSDVFRTYDVTSPLSVATTIDRVSALFVRASIEPGVKGIFNCEDEAYLGAALGCSIGVMRANLDNNLHQNDPKECNKKTDEVIRAVRWHRLAPAFGAGESTFFSSDRILADKWLFVEGDTWAEWVYGKEITQKAPAICSRGMKLPVINYEFEPPYVCASRNPNGATAVATLPRTLGDRRIFTPKADVLLEIDQTDKPIGIFGDYKTLTLQFSAPVGNLRILAQDLAGDDASDITDSIIINENQLVLTGDLIRKIGLSSATPGDLSDPGLILLPIDAAFVDVVREYNGT